MSGDLVDWHHVAEIDVNVQQIDFVHQFASFTNSFARNNHVETVDRVAASGVGAVAGAHPRYNKLNGRTGSSESSVSNGSTEANALSWPIVTASEGTCSGSNACLPMKELLPP